MPPYIRHDGTLFLVERRIEDRFVGHFGEFIASIKKSRKDWKIKNVLIEGVLISEESLIVLLTSLEDRKKFGGD